MGWEGSTFRSSLALTNFSLADNGFTPGLTVGYNDKNDLRASREAIFFSEAACSSRMVVISRKMLSRRKYACLEKISGGGWVCACVCFTVLYWSRQLRWSTDPRAVAETKILHAASGQWRSGRNHRRVQFRKDWFAGKGRWSKAKTQEIFELKKGSFFKLEAMSSADVQQGSPWV